MTLRARDRGLRRGRPRDVVRRRVHRLRTRLLRSRPLWWGPRRRRVLGVAALALVAAGGAVGLARSAPGVDLDETCDTRPFACSVATNFLSSALLATIVSVIWIGGFGQRRALRRYRRRLTTDPAALLDLPVHLTGDETRHRAALKFAVLEDLRSSARREPLVIEGDSGTGKSVTLCEIARDLTKRGLVPIVATLRASPLTTALDDHVRSIFTSLIDPFMWSSDHTDRIWRRLRRSGRVVFLFDGLDEALLPDTPTAVEIAMQRFFHGLEHLGRTVITCRPDVVPSSAACSRYLLPDLDERETLALVHQRAGPVDGPHGDAVSEALVRTEAGRCPLFADAIGQVVAQGGRVDDLPWSVDRARIALLDRTHDVVPDELAGALGRLAIGLLRMGRYEAPLTALASTATVTDAAFSYTDLEMARELGLVRTREVAREEAIRFAHPVLLAYFASRLLTGPNHELVDELTASRLPEAHQSIVWAALHHGPATWILVLSNSDSMAANRAVDLVRICGAAEADLPASVRRWIAAGVLPGAAQQHHLIAAATTTRQPWRIDVLLSLQSRSVHYGVRWRSARALSETGPSDEVTHWAEARSAEIAGTPDVDRGLQLQEGLLWFGPSVVDTDELTADHWLTTLAAQVRRASELELPGALGAESSLAQGLKLAATLGRPADAALFEQLIRGARFWFARLEAALAVGALADAERAPHAARRLAQLACRDPHPLVKAAGGLAARCWEAGSSARLVWLNEHTAINEPMSDLAPEATLLLAETALLLNLSNNGSQLQRDLNGQRTELPACLADEQHRAALAGLQCVETCPFGLCPYEEHSASRWSRGSFPQAFCRSVRHAVEEVGPPPWYRGSTGGYLAFWRELEKEGHPGGGGTANGSWSTMRG